MRLRVRPILLAAAAALTWSCGAGAEPVHSAVLITLDTTRWDALAAHGAPADCTPALDRLVAEGVSYRWARTASPLTLPSHASMHTGLFPPRHGIRGNGQASLPQEAVTIAERAREEGLETAAFVSAVVLERRFGLDQGFALYDQPARTERRLTSSYTESPGRDTVARAKAWLAALAPTARFFLWIHLFDAHMPYEPRRRFVQCADGNAYLGEVAAMDEVVGRLMRQLEASGRLERTAVLVVGDHGESLGEHGEETHGSFCYEGVMRVPFVIRHPDGRRAGERSEEIVSVVDVAPTLASALGLEALPDIDGRDLYHGRAEQERGVYFEAYDGYLNYGWSPLAGWVDRRGKYLHSSSPEFFLPASDPGELENQFDDARTASYREALAAVFAAPALPRAEDAAVGEDLLEQLRALGYVTGADPRQDVAPALEVTDRPAPNERVDELRAFQWATGLANAGRYAESVEHLERVLATNPTHAAALDKLGFCLVELGRFGESIEVLTRCVAQGTASASAHVNLGWALDRTGHPEQARVHYELALQRDPTHPTARANLEGLRSRHEGR